MSMNLSEFATEDGRIYRIVGHTREVYLDTPPIKIVEKLGHSRSPDEVNTWDFTFLLNDSPDEKWKAIFQRYLEGLQAGIEFKILTIPTIPANIKGRLEKVKAAIDRANENYEASRKMLIGRILQNQNQLKSAEKRQEEGNEAAKQAFDDLQI